MANLIDAGLVVEARAPGKVIVSGEHAVVHGTAAVAAALDRHTIVRMKRSVLSAGEDGALSLDLPDLKLRLKWEMTLIKQVLDVSSTDVDHLSTDQTERLKHVIQNFVQKEMPSDVERGASEGVTALLFLYVSILGLHPLEVVITSELPVGAGLGSSAAFCVAVTGALLTVAGKLGSHFVDLNGKWMDIAEKGQNLVNKWAFEGEKILHGRPSGVDNTVSCYGHVVKFKKGDITRLECHEELRMLITNTKVSRNTKALVAGVAELADRHPEVMDSLFKVIDAISEEIVTLLESPYSCDEKELTKVTVENNAPKLDANLVMLNGMSINTNKLDGSKVQSLVAQRPNELTKLEELMILNQGLLQCIGVSHPSIETICQTTSRCNLVSKLTGAGGGGCVLTLLPNGSSDTTIQNVKFQLEQSGFECFEAGIGGKGLQIGYRPSLMPFSQ